MFELHNRVRTVRSSTSALVKRQSMRSCMLLLPLFSRKGWVAPKHITMLLLDLDSWSIVEQIDFIYRATRITINFCSRSYGRVTTAHWKWLNFWKFAPSVLSVCSQFLSCLLQLQFSHPRRHFSEIFWLESTYYNLLNFQNLYQLLSYLENWAC